MKNLLVWATKTITGTGIHNNNQKNGIVGDILAHVSVFAAIYPLYNIIYNNHHTDNVNYNALKFRFQLIKLSIKTHPHHHNNIKYSCCIRAELNSESKLFCVYTLKLNLFLCYNTGFGTKTSGTCQYGFATCFKYYADKCCSANGVHI